MRARPGLCQSPGPGLSGGVEFQFLRLMITPQLTPAKPENSPPFHRNLVFLSFVTPHHYPYVLASSRLTFGPAFAAPFTRARTRRSPTPVPSQSDHLRTRLTTNSSAIAHHLTPHHTMSLPGTDKKVGKAVLDALARKPNRSTRFQRADR